MSLLYFSYRLVMKYGPGLVLIVVWFPCLFLPAMAINHRPPMSLASIQYQRLSRVNLTGYPTKSALSPEAETSPISSSLMSFDYLTSSNSYDNLRSPSAGSNAGSYQPESVGYASQMSNLVTLKGKVAHATTKAALPDILVQIVNTSNKITYTDSEGKFELKGLQPGVYQIQFSGIGHKTRVDTVEVNNRKTQSMTFVLEDNIIQLAEIQITPRRELSQTTINSVDFKLRNHTTTQDLLRLVPGLFIAQHAGGGKAEQIFLRGFDVDHGTDIAITVDNMPVNMVSHAHGQGYADLHFVIPETVSSMSFAKGPYDARTGDLNTAGSVRFQTKNYLPNNMVKYEAGRFGFNRGVVMLNLLGKPDTSASKHSAYIASEYFYTPGFFLHSQHFHRFNGFGKYLGQLSKNTSLAFSLSTFASNWDASGQIPKRAVDRGDINWYGSIDPTEGGKTSRTNANLTLTSELKNGAVLKNQLYYINYNFSLYSNFTFFKEDSIHGDQIHQFEYRNVLGYNGSYTQDVLLGNVVTKLTAGMGVRQDFIRSIGLEHTQRQEFLNDVRRGVTTQTNGSGFAEASFYISDKWTLNTGLRYELFRFNYVSQLNDSLGGTLVKGILSPKLNVYYKVARNVQLYASAGSGFHSNDARVAVQTPGIVLPKAISADFGSNFKIGRKLFVNAAVWAMNLQTEFVYGGDDGLIGPSGSTRRIGLDISARYQLRRWLFMDADLSLAKPRFVALPEGENFVTLAPTVTSVGGLGVAFNNGLSGSLRYRYLGPRPAIEDNSVVASGYCIVDAVMNYQKKHFGVNASVENLFNRKWREAQFGTESRLRGEPNAVTEIHFTPGTPFFIKAGISYLF